MAINFPSSPTNGQTYTEAGATWVYSATKQSWSISISGTIEAHTHAFAALTSKPTTIAGYGITDGAAHTHAQSAVTNLVSDLAGKAASVHTHVATDISNSTVDGRALLTAASPAAQRTVLQLGTSAILNVGTGANQIVQLNGSSQLPAVNGSLLTNVKDSFTEYDKGAFAIATTYSQAHGLGYVPRCEWFLEFTAAVDGWAVGDRIPSYHARDLSQNSGPISVVNGTTAYLVSHLTSTFYYYVNGTSVQILAAAAEFKVILRVYK
jgi:hypothetical protein